MSADNGRAWHSMSKMGWREVLKLGWSPFVWSGWACGSRMWTVIINIIIITIIDIFCKWLWHAKKVKAAWSWLVWWQGIGAKEALWQHDENCEYHCHNFLTIILTMINTIIIFCKRLKGESSRSVWKPRRVCGSKIWTHQPLRAQPRSRQGRSASDNGMGVASSSSTSELSSSRWDFSKFSVISPDGNMLWTYGVGIWHCYVPTIKISLSIWW